MANVPDKNEEFFIYFLYYCYNYNNPIIANQCIRSKPCNMPFYHHRQDDDKSNQNCRISIAPFLGNLSNGFQSETLTDNK